MKITASYIFISALSYQMLGYYSIFISMETCLIWFRLVIFFYLISPWMLTRFSLARKPTNLIQASLCEELLQQSTRYINAYIIFSVIWKHNMPLACVSHVFFIRWLLILLCAHKLLINYFDLLKALGYIERVVTSDIFSEKTYFT